MSIEATRTQRSPALELPASGRIILCADDYGMTDGVSRGIEELALARRLSATSAMVTLPAWKSGLPALRRLRGFIAVGLHLNLTVGEPLGPMPHLAPDDELPTHPVVLRRCLTVGVDLNEVAAEIDRQLARFEEDLGHPPDFVDGHQHVHALPGIRAALIAVMRQRYQHVRPLVRDPADSVVAITRRGASTAKSLVIAALSRGIGRRARAAGFPTNHGFSGVSAFDIDRPFSTELETFMRVPGRRHLVMCHPGYPDAALADLDPIVARRHQELDALFAADGLESAIWHVRRNADGPPIDWAEALPA